MAKISIIVPVFQVENFIERCAVSLFSQTMEDIEYIFVNDGSNDDSIAVLKKTLERFPHRKNNVKIIENEHNLGLHQTRKIGIEAATGDYYMFCDSDDWVEPQMCSQMFESAINESADIVICKFDYLRADNVLEIQGIDVKPSKTQVLTDMLFQRQSWSLVNKLFKRSLFDNKLLWAAGNMGEDMALCIQLVYYSDRIVFVPEIFYHYCLNSHSIIQKSDYESCVKKFDAYFQNYKVICGFFESKGLSEQLHLGIMWLEYNMKNVLFQPDSECLKYWRKIFPGLQYRVLLMPGIDFATRISVLKIIIKSYYYPFLFRK